MYKSWYMNGQLKVEKIIKLVRMIDYLNFDCLIITKMILARIYIKYMIILLKFNTSL